MKFKGKLMENNLSQSKDKNVLDIKATNASKAQFNKRGSSQLN